MNTSRPLERRNGNGNGLAVTVRNADIDRLDASLLGRSLRVAVKLKMSISKHVLGDQVLIRIGINLRKRQGRPSRHSEPQCP